MRVLVDNLAVAGQPGCSNIREGLAAAAAAARTRNRLIVEVLVDGETWTDEQIAGPQGARTARELSITTADPTDLVMQTLLDASEALLQADAKQQAAAEKIQAGELAQAMPMLNEAFSVWLNVQQAVSLGAEVAAIDLTVAEPAIDELNQRLRGVRDNLQAGDTAALADALLYDFPQAVLDWRRLLNDLRSRLAGHAA